MKNTRIEWADHTINFWIGCPKISDGCKHCYMHREQKRYGGDPNAVRRTAPATWNMARRLNAQAAEKNNGKGVPDTVFTCSWSDFFLEEADPWRGDAWRLIRETPWLIWLILTKRTENIADRLPGDWGDGYDNVWLGASVESPYELDRLDDMSRFPAKHLFISHEPGLMEVSFLRWLPVGEWACEECDWRGNDLRDRCLECNAYGYFPDYPVCRVCKSRNTYESCPECDEEAPLLVGGEPGTFHWLILGGESGGREARPFEEKWVRYNVEECRAAGIPVFTKQLGSHWARENGAKDHKGADPAEWPEPFPRETPWD